MEKDFLKQYIAGYEKSSVDILWVTETAYGNSIRNRISYPKIDPLWHMIYVESVSSHFCITDLFYTSWVCILFTRKMYDKTGGLDNDFFMYFEEIDWIWRARLYGYTIWQLRDIFIHHAGSGSTGSGIKYNAFLWRNQNTLQMLLKNYRWYNLFWNLPVYILQNIVEIFFFLIILKPKIAWSYVEGWIFNIRFLKRTLKKRYLIQSNRCVSEIEILKKMYFWLAKWKHLITFFSRHE
jgi:GT2 family glycosyltransferase